MSYITIEEYSELGFDEVTDFDKLLKRAEIAINLYIQGALDLDKEPNYRSQAVKLATAFQIAYLDSSGILTADDKQNISSLSIGRTSITYNNPLKGSTAHGFNLSLDAENVLKQAGFSSIVGVSYDR